MKKKVGIWLGVFAVLAVLGGAGYRYRAELMAALPFFQEGSPQDKVYVEKVSRVMNTYAGISNRFNGIVESQDIHEIKVDSERTVGEIKVEVGDVVEEGQTLLEYDTSDLQMQVKQAKLEIESIRQDIDNYNRQIAELMKESEGVPEDERFTYTTQIQNIQNSIQQRQFDQQSKELEISKYQAQIDKSTLESTVSGIVREINEKGVDANGEQAPFMTIQQEGEYRIKGSIDEQNIWTISEGQEVLVRSRVDEDQTWSGTISVIDMESPEQSSSDYAVSSDDMMTASKYPFYIELDTASGLILGQHVYIELDFGQEEEKEGLWLSGSYILQDEETPYVWAANEKNRLEKRYVELGEYDAGLDEYEILSGLSGDDYVAWPMPGLYEGVTTVTDEAEVDYSAPLYQQETGGTESAFPEEQMFPEGSEFPGESVFPEELMEDTESAGTEEMP